MSIGQLRDGGPAEAHPGLPAKMFPAIPVFDMPKTLIAKGGESVAQWQVDPSGEVGLLDMSELRC